MKEHVFEARDVLVAHGCDARGRSVTEDGADGAPRSARLRDRRRAARRRARGRARHAARRPVRRPPARRHGRRDDQGRGARKARPAARLGQGALRGALALVAGAVAQQEVHHAQPPRASGARSSCSSSSSSADVAHRELPPGHARALEPRLRAALRRRTPARPRARLRLRPDRARTPSGRASPRSRRRWAGSATSTASRTSRRRACTSRSATRSPACSPCRGSSRRSTSATSLGGGPRPGRRRLADGGVASRCSRARCPSTTGSASSAGRRART